MGVGQGKQWMQAALGLNTQTVSAELLSLLHGAPKDRIFMFFRQPHGHMIAASHGKYHSESDRDLSKINPLVSPPNVNEWKKISCDNSTDVLIAQSCKQLLAKYGGWDRIPAQATEMTLNGSRYWVDVGHSTSDLNFTVVLLKDRASVMGAIEASQAAVVQQVNDSNANISARVQADRQQVAAEIDASNKAVVDDVEAKKVLTYIILTIACALGILAPLLIGAWLGRKLVKLAARMDEIATLNFSGRAMAPRYCCTAHLSTSHPPPRCIGGVRPLLAPIICSAEAKISSSDNVVVVEMSGLGPHA